MGPLRTVAAAHPEAHVVAYFDDINVVGPADSAVRACDRLTTEVLSVGLTPVPTKCAVYGGNTDMARAPAAELSIAHQEQGVVVAGTPIGSDDFVKAVFQQEIQNVRAPLDLLVSLPTPLTRQDKWAVLNRSPHLKLQHLTRTVPWQLCAPLLQAHTADLRRAALHVPGQPSPVTDGLNPAAVHLQLHLPLRAAGFGVLHFPPDLCAASFVSSCARAEAALQAASPSLRPFVSPPWRRMQRLDSPASPLPRHFPS
jgi:hypothetical protein